MLGRTRDWLRYDLPPELRRRPPRRGRLSTGRRRDGGLRGQKQIWFLLRFTGQDADVQLDLSGRPEFDAWRWITYWQALEEIIDFKHKVYHQTLTKLTPLTNHSTTN